MAKPPHEVVLADFSTQEFADTFLKRADGKELSKNILLGALVRDALATSGTGDIGNEVGVSSTAIFDLVKTFYAGRTGGKTSLDSMLRSNKDHWGIESFKVGSDTMWRLKTSVADLKAAGGWPAKKKKKPPGAQSSGMKRPIGAISAESSGAKRSKTADTAMAVQQQRSAQLAVMPTPQFGPTVHGGDSAPDGGDLLNIWVDKHQANINAGSVNILGEQGVGKSFTTTAILAARDSAVIAGLPKTRALYDLTDAIREGDGKTAVYEALPDAKPELAYLSTMFSLYDKGLQYIIPPLQMSAAGGAQALKTMKAAEGYSTTDFLAEDVELTDTTFDETSALGLFALNYKGRGGSKVLEKDNGLESKQIITGGLWVNKGVRLWASGHYGNDFSMQPHPTKETGGVSSEALPMDLQGDWKFQTLLGFFNTSNGQDIGRKADDMMGSPFTVNTWAHTIENHMGDGSYDMLKLKLKEVKPFGGFAFFLNEDKPKNYLKDPWTNFCIIDPSVGKANVEAFAKLQKDGHDTNNLVEMWQELSGGSVWDDEEEEEGGQ